MGTEDVKVTAMNMYKYKERLRLYKRWPAIFLVHYVPGSSQDPPQKPRRPWVRGCPHNEWSRACAFKFNVWVPIPLHRICAPRAGPSAMTLICFSFLPNAAVNMYYHPLRNKFKEARKGFQLRARA